MVFFFMKEQIYRMSDSSPTDQAIALIALHAGYSHSSLALHSIATFSADQAYYPKIQIFESLVNKSQQQLLEQLVGLQPAVIGFSTYLWNIQACLHLTGLLDQLLPDSLILLGGPEAGPRGEELLAQHPELDFVIDGEGEAAFRDLLRWHFYVEGDLGDISGLIYRAAGGIERNPIQTLPVEQIPAPIASGAMDFSKPLVYWETSRGCPFKCTFCTSATDRLRAFPLERIEADLVVLEGLSNKTIKLLDRSFHLGKDRTVKLLERFTATPEGLRFHLELNPDRISAEAMGIFRRAAPGKFQFEIGLQTLTEPVLDAIERRMQVPLALENIRQLVEMVRHPVHLDLIVGLPGEDAAHCRDSLNRVFLLHAEHLQLGTLKLLPGTPLLAQAEQFGYRWDREPPYEVLSHPLLSFQEIARFKLYAELLERLWNSGYLVSTLIWLVAGYFHDHVADCFDALLEQVGEGIARDNLQPDRLFGLISGFLEPMLADDRLLRELLLWDYSQFSLVNGKTPAWIAQWLQQSVALPVAGSRRRLPVLELSAEAVGIINRHRLEPLEPGHYAVWPRQHKKAKPVEIMRVPRPES
jgi:anaerobic magnesium-protoporphyrin IX monomethyl ester cyclase